MSSHYSLLRYYDNSRSADSVFWQKATNPRSKNLSALYSQCLKTTQNVAFLILHFWHFPPIFVILKMTCLVTLFDRKLQVLKNSPKLTIFGFLMNFCPLHFARNVECDFLGDFQTLCALSSPQNLLEEGLSIYQSHLGPVHSECFSDCEL